MSSKELFDIFYSVPNPHFNAFFEASTGASEKHPLADLVANTSVETPGPSAAAAPGAIWRVINRPNRDSAVAFINLAPAQKAGEAAFSNRPDGTVDTYYFL